MGNSLSQRIANAQKHQKNTGHKAAFLAQKADIAEALADGWSKKIIWETLTREGKIAFSYKTFCGYVINYSANTNTPDMQENTREDEQAKRESAQAVRGFTFNPKPNLEELL